MTIEFSADAIYRAANQQLELAEKLKAAGQAQQVAELYKSWIAANPDHPMLYAVYFNYGVVLGELRDTAGAAIVFRAAMQLKPDFYPPYINLGSLLDGQGQPDRAVREWLAVVNQLPAVTGDAVTYKTMALKQIGRVLEVSNKDTAAEDAL